MLEVNVDLSRTVHSESCVKINIKIFVYSLFSGASKGSTKAFKENKN